MAFYALKLGFLFDNLHSVCLLQEDEPAGYNFMTLHYTLIVTRKYSSTRVYILNLHCGQRGLIFFVYSSPVSPLKSQPSKFAPIRFPKLTCWWDPIARRYLSQPPKSPCQTIHMHLYLPRTFAIAKIFGFVLILLLLLHLCTHCEEGSIIRDAETIFYRTDWGPSPSHRFISSG